MPTLVIPKTYRNNEVLREQDLDNIRTSLLTFFNTIKLDATNLQLDSIISSLTATQVGDILDKATSSTVNDFLDKASQVAAEAFYAKSEIYDTNSSQKETSYSPTTSFSTRLTYTFQATGEYLLSFGAGDSDASAGLEIRVQNDSVTIDPILFTSVGGFSSYSLIIDGVDETDLILQLRRIDGSGGSVSSYLQVVRVS